jgi:hypothetical protein
MSAVNPPSAKEELDPGKSRNRNLRRCRRSNRRETSRRRNFQIEKQMGGLIWRVRIESRVYAAPRKWRKK